MRPAMAVVLLSASLCLPSVPVAADAASENDPGVLRLLFVDPLEQAGFAYPGLVRSSEQALAALGIAARWEHLAARDELPAGLRVVLLTRPSPHRPRTMGLVARQSAPITHIYVFRATLAEALGLEDRDPSGWTLLERARFAHGLGRVIAHEVVHALRPRLPHASHGLLSASLGRKQLLDASVRWDVATRLSMNQGPLSPVARPSIRFPAAFEASSMVLLARQP
jgi:hypothetical protein